MIGLDTNILIRYFTQDDDAQYAAAAKVINALTPDLTGFVSQIVIAELMWVCQFSYHFKKQELEHVVEKLLRSKELVVERAEIVAQSLVKFRHSRANFADCLIERCSQAAGCEYTLTFDKGAVSGGMQLLET